jgi:putative holliday junction resolvase
MTQTLLACDFGLKHIGLAAGQTLTRTATPLGVVRARNGAPDWNAFDEWMRQWKPDLLVVGLPLNMDDTVSEMATQACRFAERLRQRYRIPVEMVDERLSSFEARLRSGKREANHALAAQLIAETYLDTQQRD